LRLRRLAALVIVLGLLALALPAIAHAEGLAAPSPYHITGTVVNRTGQPLAHVIVSATNYTTGAPFDSVTDAQGSYNLTLPAGVYNLTAVLLNFTANSSYAGVRIVAQSLAGLNFTMSEVLGQVNGFVTSEGAPVPGTKVILSSSTKNYSASTTLIGAYMIEGVSPGVYVARAEKKGYNTSFITEPITVSRGVALQLNFSMVAQPAKLFGKVTVAGSPEEGVTVILMRDGLTLKQTLTDVKGNYSFSNIASGDYLVSFEKQGLVQKQVPITLEAFENRDLSVSLDRVAVPGTPGFIGDLDLTHSLMVVALIMAVLVMLLALFLYSRARKKPSILAIEEEEEPKDKEKRKNIK
jgi:hypothetical protein